MVIYKKRQIFLIENQIINEKKHKEKIKHLDYLKRKLQKSDNKFKIKNSRKRINQKSAYL